jgi:hypothetical protein
MVRRSLQNYDLFSAKAFLHFLAFEIVPQNVGYKKKAFLLCFSSKTKIPLKLQIVIFHRICAKDAV